MQIACPPLLNLVGLVHNKVVYAPLVSLGVLSIFLEIILNGAFIGSAFGHIRIKLIAVVEICLVLYDVLITVLVDLSFLYLAIIAPAVVVSPVVFTLVIMIVVHLKVK